MIQRDERTSKAQLYYAKLPSKITDDGRTEYPCKAADIASHLTRAVVLLLEPMLATGGSVVKAVESLKSYGVPEDSIVLVNVVASKKGLDVVSSNFPELKVVSAAVDAELTVEK